MVVKDVGPDFDITPLLRHTPIEYLNYAREDFPKTPYWRNKSLGGGMTSFIHILAKQTVLRSCASILERFLSCGKCDMLSGVQEILFGDGLLNIGRTIEKTDCLWNVVPHKCMC